MSSSARSQTLRAACSTGSALPLTTKAAAAARSRGYLWAPAPEQYLVLSLDGMLLFLPVILQSADRETHGSEQVCALRATCTALARGWDDARVLAELLSGRRRPADFGLGELRGTGRFLRLLDLIDAAHGPRVPQDYNTISEAVRHAARRVRGYRNAQPNGRETLTVRHTNTHRLLSHFHIQI